TTRRRSVGSSSPASGATVVHSAFTRTASSSPSSGPADLVRRSTGVGRGCTHGRGRWPTRPAPGNLRYLARSTFVTTCYSPVGGPRRDRPQLRRGDGDLPASGGGG